MTETRPKPIAVLDACVLYPPSLRDLLMRVAVAGAYEPRWTEEIQEEWTRNVLADNPNVTSVQLNRTSRLMNQAVPTGLVSGYEALIPALSLPDQKDRHVLAAAITAGAAMIVIYNLSDFPAASLETYGIRSAHPDDFLSALFDEQPDLVLRAIQMHRASLRHPPKDATGYLDTLKANRLTQVAVRLILYHDDI